MLRLRAAHETARVHHTTRRRGSSVAGRDARAAARADIPGRRHLRGRTMITKFDSAYYGTVDMENLGYAGTPINERRYSQAELGGALHKVVEYAKCMDERGYDTFWMAEHHFQPEGTELIPNLLMMAMHLCGVTKNLRIGCGFNVVPMWHPLRLAEDYAMADILTGGRVIFGVARGYHTREVETFGAPLRDQEANRELFEEGVDILFKAFEGKPFSHKGKYYTIPPEVPYRGYTLKEITLVPAPERLPAGRMLAADPERLGAGLRLHGQARHLRHHRRRLCRGRRRRAAHDRLPGRLCAPRHRARARRAACAGLPVSHREEPRRRHGRGGQTLRGEHEDVRRVAPRAGADRRADRRDARSTARRHDEIAARRGRGEGRRLPDRYARRHHRAIEGRRKTLSGRRPGGMRHAAGDPPRGPAGRPGSIREGGHARLPPGQDRRSGGVVQRRRRAREWLPCRWRRSCHARPPSITV